MSGEINTLHFHEQDNIFRSILGMEFMEEKNNYTAVDKKVIGFVERRRRRPNNGFTDKKEDADKTKNILLTLPEL